MRRRIVIGLELACGLLDSLPGIWWEGGRPRFARHALYGCSPPLRLAHRALELDAKWGTEVWGRPAERSPDEIADAFESYEPKPEDFDAPLPPRMAEQLEAFKRSYGKKLPEQPDRP